MDYIEDSNFYYDQNTKQFIGNFTVPGTYTYQFDFSYPSAVFKQFNLTFDIIGIYLKISNYENSKSDENPNIYNISNNLGCRNTLLANYR
jgi:hypothetical protein